MKAVKLKRPNGTWSPPIVREDELERSVRKRLHLLDGPFTITQPGVSSGPPRPKMEAAERFSARLWAGEVGLHLLCQNEANKGVHGRVVESAPTPVNTMGSPGVDLLVGFLNAQFPGRWEQWGIYVYRHIAGSSTWSDHAYVSRPNWCGRAIDIHPDTMTVGDLIKATVQKEPAIMNRLRYVLWRVPDHYDHLHFSFDDGGAPGRC